MGVCSQYTSSYTHLYISRLPVWSILELSVPVLTGSETWSKPTLPWHPGHKKPIVTGTNSYRDQLLGNQNSDRRKGLLGLNTVVRDQPYCFRKYGYSSWVLSDNYKYSWRLRCPRIQHDSICRKELEALLKLKLSDLCTVLLVMEIFSPPPPPAPPTPRIFLHERSSLESPPASLGLTPPWLAVSFNSIFFPLFKESMLNMGSRRGSPISATFPDKSNLILSIFCHKKEQNFV